MSSPARSSPLDDDDDVLAEINAAFRSGGMEAYLNAVSDVPKRGRKGGSPGKPKRRRYPRHRQDHRTFRLKLDAKDLASKWLEGVAASAGRLWDEAANYIEAEHRATGHYPWFARVSAWVTRQKREPGYEWLKAMPDDTARATCNALVGAYLKLIRSRDDPPDPTKRDPKAVSLHFRTYG